MHEIKNYKVVRNIAICVLVFLCITLVCLLTNLFAFYKHFLLGTFGLLIYPIILLAIAYNILILTNRFLRFNAKSLVLCLVTLLMFVCILHTALSSGYDLSSYGAYISECYNTGTSVGGVIIGTIVYPFRALLFDVGAYVAFSIGLIVTIAMIIDSYYDKTPQTAKKPNAQIEKITFTQKVTNNTPKAVQPTPEAMKNESELDKERNMAKDILGLNKNKQEETVDASTYLYGKGITRSEAMNTLYSKNNDIKSQNPNYLNYSLDKYIDENVKKPSKIIHNDSSYREPNTTSQRDLNREYIEATRPRIYNNGNIISGDNYSKYKEEINFVDETTLSKHNKIFDEIKKEENYNSFVNQTSAPRMEDPNPLYSKPIEVVESKPQIIEEPEVEEIKQAIEFEVVEEEQKSQPVRADNEVVFEAPKANRTVEYENKQTSKPAFAVEEEPPKIEKKTFNDEEVFKQNTQVTTEEVAPPPKPYKPIKYKAPSLEFLTTESSDNTELFEDSVKRKDLLEVALENFRIPAKVTDVVIGPAVTRYEIAMPPGISVKKVLGYSDDIAMALEAKGDVRIEAPIPGKNAVGIEVPNDTIATVGLREVLGSKQFAAQKSPLSFVLGKDISGEYRFCDLKNETHLLIAGSTGSGKSVCLNTLIISLLYRSSPEDLRLILVDPKRVEFATYSGLPHLMMPTIINDPEKALNVFNWTVNEMERRYMLFEKNMVRDIGEYNQMPEIVNKQAPKMPYIVMIVDELADLMSNNKKEFEDKIARLSAKSRSAGIHLVLATQRPSVDVITGVIKNNLPSRIAFAVTSGADSKTILDQGGAEKLLGRGDMLFWSRSASEPSRIQGTYISNREIINIVQYIKDNNVSQYEDNIEKKMTSKNFGVAGNVNALARGEEDELFPAALKIVIESGRPSKTFLQRCLRLGFSRAANLIDAMEQLHYVTPAENGKKGEVFITMEEFKEKYGDI